MQPKILVVDDEEVTRKAMAKAIEHEGYTVITAGGGVEALELLKAHDVGVMLLDLQMPDMDGIEVMRRTHEISPDTRVVILTGHGSLESAIAALRQEAFDYILKPPSIQELISAVARGLASREEEKRRRMILGQIENSLQQLKEVEGIVDSPPPKRKLISLPDGVMLDLARRQLWRGNDQVRLTPTESKLMEVFVKSWGRVLSHGDLVFLVQGYEVDEAEAPEVLRPLISRLRRKLEAFPNGPRWISSVRGKGYVFDANRPG